MLFLAYGVVPHQWLTHADSELLWRPDQILTGPKVGDKGILSYLPFQMTYQTVRDIVVVLIYVFFLGCSSSCGTAGRSRGKKKAVPELPASSYGRPLVKKG